MPWHSDDRCSAALKPALFFFSEMSLSVVESQTHELDATLVISLMIRVVKYSQTKEKSAKLSFLEIYPLYGIIMMYVLEKRLVKFTSYVHIVCT